MKPFAPERKWLSCSAGRRQHPGTCQPGRGASGGGGGGVTSRGTPLAYALGGALVLALALLGLCLWQGAVAREWLVGVGRPLSAEAFAPLLRRPRLDFARLAAGARGGSFLGVLGGRFDMEAPPLREELRAECPLAFLRPSLADVAAGAAKPYLFGGQRPGCVNCNDPAKGRWCAYDSELSHSGAPICPAAEQATLMAHFNGRAAAGDAWAANMLRMTPCDLWPFLRGRTLWLLGDSITQESMRASECFLQEFWGAVPPWSKPSANESAIATSKTAGGVDPWCMELVQGARVCHLRSNNGASWADHVLPVFDGLGVRRDDIVLANFALWINKEPELRANLTAFADYVAAHAEEMPFIVWRDSSAQHFNTPDGDYVGVSWPWSCRAIGDDPEAMQLAPDGTLSSDRPELQVIVQGGWRNKILSPVVAGLGVPVMETWNQTVPLWQYNHHYNPTCGDRYDCGDCTHTCHPSMYEMWLYHLYETLLDSQDALLAHWAGRPQIRPHGPGAANTL
ncbi:hypothetical protein WJX81_000941 [Elliptochloris bilobata]|uniref:Trichome birefringence-like N-terminal domain-containing protein n=1 Tax=Elliptochloris bilobata TaxID=381761 RepID=A0AAW1QWK0_9CHLO